MSKIGKLVCGLAIAACTTLGAVSSSFAASPDGLKLYVFSSGWLTSDAAYSTENLNQHVLSSIGLAYDPTGILNGYAFIRRQPDLEHGDVIFAHDPDVFKAHKQAPDFYE